MSQSFDIYLASSSPRRRELLEQIGVRYALLQVAVPEIPLPGEKALAFVQRVALGKARAAKALLPADDGHPVLGADTAVVLDDCILGKPADKRQAFDMLSRLSGRSHEVMSAVAMVTEREIVMVNISRVTFRSLTQTEIEAYWASGECHDKAGAYAVQGRAAMFIRDLQGSYSGVMGLPLYETAILLQQCGINPLR